MVLIGFLWVPIPRRYQGALFLVSQYGRGSHTLLPPRMAALGGYWGMQGGYKNWVFCQICFSMLGNDALAIWKQGDAKKRCNWL